jgi:coenzyme F420-reducing hydrogenase beta subunit
MRPPDPPALSRAEVVRAGLCIGCGACAAADGDSGAGMALDHHGLYRPEGPPGWLARPSATLARTCPFSPAAADETALAAARFPAAPHRDDRLGRFEAAYVGHAAEPGLRDGGSSGGMVTWVAAALLDAGLVDAVAHVAPADAGGARFAYRLSRSPAELRAGARSRYYPVELSGVLAEIRAVPGRYAVVGVPCFVKAIHLLRAADPLLAERIAFTLGLFCGHMKSARMIESFAWQMGTEIAAAERIDYRMKDPSRPANWYVAELGLRSGEVRSRHWWDMADGDWGAGFFQSPACDACDDVVAETADVSFGDAWVEPFSSDPRGTNVVVVRSPAIAALIAAGRADGRLALDPVNADFVAGTQAAGLRHRREGLAYRLTWRRFAGGRGLKPRKRVAPSARGLPLRRRLVYRARHGIAVWSHRVFALARRLGRPGLYLAWARAALAAYQGLAYSRGRLGRLADRLLPPDSRAG